jgi:ATP-dependent RNA helicase CshB
VNEEIKKIIRRTEKQKVKPGYKKKMREEIDKVKRKHRRSVIEADIKKRIVERAKEKTKAIKSVSEGEL